MRHILGCLIGWLVAFWIPSAWSAPLTLQCKTDVSTYSWYPLRLEVIARITEGRVMQELTRSGRLTLLPKGSKQAADIQLQINARIIEDAGQFSTFASVTPRNQERLGSFAAVSTRSLLQRNHSQIQQQIEEAAQEAGQKLMSLLGPRLVQLTSDDTVPFTGDANLPLNWGEGVFKARVNERALSQLQDVMSRAQKEAGARLQLAQCAAQSRIKQWSQCVEALAQLAKRHPMAQRAIVAMLVGEPPSEQAQWGDWQRARLKAFQVSTTFVGPALDEAVQAWLYIFGADRSGYGYYLFGHRREDYSILDAVARYLLNTPNVPNLDLALARCTKPSKTKGMPESSCLEVLKTISVSRRVALLYKYLAAPPRYDVRASDSTWGKMLATVIDRDKALHPMVTKICVNMLQRGFYWRFRADCVEAMARSAAVNRALADVLFESYLNDKEIQQWTSEALYTLAKRDLSYCDYFKKKLAPYVARRAYPEMRRDYQNRLTLPLVMVRCEELLRKAQRRTP
jgi:hypothetical protein